jgi:hypothetical protein
VEDENVSEPRIAPTTAPRASDDLDRITSRVEGVYQGLRTHHDLLHEREEWPEGSEMFLMLLEDTLKGSVAELRDLCDRVRAAERAGAA